MGHCEFMGRSGNAMKFDAVFILRIFNWMSNMHGYNIVIVRNGKTCYVV
jgi:hypothetical protein